MNHSRAVRHSASFSIEKIPRNSTHHNSDIAATRGYQSLDRNDDHSSHHLNCARSKSGMVTWLNPKFSFIGSILILINIALLHEFKLWVNLFHCSETRNLIHFYVKCPFDESRGVLFEARKKKHAQDFNSSNG